MVPLEIQPALSLVTPPLRFTVLSLVQVRAKGPDAGASMVSERLSVMDGMFRDCSHPRKRLTIYTRKHWYMYIFSIYTYILFLIYPYIELQNRFNIFIYVAYIHTSFMHYIYIYIYIYVHIYIYILHSRFQLVWGSLAGIIYCVLGYFHITHIRNNYSRHRHSTTAEPLRFWKTGRSHSR